MATKIAYSRVNKAKGISLFFLSGTSIFFANPNFTIIKTINNGNITVDKIPDSKRIVDLSEFKEGTNQIKKSKPIQSGFRAEDIYFEMSFLLLTG